tara:strand:- start:83 stop:502 length:420 start_codon:yes stop_codon:yes gene_type:complete
MSERNVFRVKSLIKNANRVIEKEAVIYASSLEWFESKKYYSFEADIYCDSCGKWSIEVFCSIREVEGGKNIGRQSVSYTTPSMFKVLDDSLIDKGNIYLNSFISTLRSILRNNGLNGIQFGQTEITCKIPDFFNIEGQG